MMERIKRRLGVVLSLVLVWAGSVASADIIGTFVQADVGNTSPASAVDASLSHTADNIWSQHTEAAHGTGSSGTAWFSTDGDDCPEIAITANGLDNTKVYDVYGLFWSWDATIVCQLGLQSGNLTTYSKFSAEAIDTGVGSWDGDHLYQVLLGTVSGVDSVTVYADDVAADNRSYVLGLSYEAVPEPATMALVAISGGLLLRRRKR